MPENIQEKSSVEERLTEAAVKSMEKQVSEQTATRLQQGQNPQDILTQLLGTIGQQNSSGDLLEQLTNLSQVPVPTGEKQGVISSLIKGKGLKKSDIEEPLGFDNAIRVLQLQQQQSQSQSRVPQQKADLLNSLIDIAVKTNNPQLQQALGVQQKTEVLERDPRGNLTVKGIKRQQELERDQTKQIEQIKLDNKVIEQISNIGNIAQDVDNLFDTFLEVPSSLRGPVQGRVIGGLAALSQTSEPLAVFEDTKQFFLSNIARQLGGERGVLTDRDIKRVEGLLPKKVDKDSVALDKINQAIDFINRRIDVAVKRVSSDRRSSVEKLKLQKRKLSDFKSNKSSSVNQEFKDPAKMTVAEIQEELRKIQGK